MGFIYCEEGFKTKGNGSPSHLVYVVDFFTLANPFEETEYPSPCPLFPGGLGAAPL